MATTAPGLLRLPLEIRQQIYHYTLVQDFRGRNIYISATQRHGYYKLHGLESMAGLIFTNRAIHSEVLCYCFSRFNFHLCNNTESIRFVVREFYRQIGPSNRKLVKHITVPKFSIEDVFFHPVNMVALFASSRARYLQLLDEMQGIFHVLERFSALEELDLGLHLDEVRRSKMGQPWVKRSGEQDMQSSAADDEHGAVSPNQARGSYVLETMEDLRHFPANVKIGIWWISHLADPPIANINNARKQAIQHIRSKIAPIQVNCLGDIPLGAWQLDDICQNLG
ncbi:hypothetical protein DDE83_001592 [Stemphylium lycopersici]|uniref:Uncharacterized protein n=1 Tax=Stemphylium lycopersici TaxID=183478 RepID=A0A364NCF9_STELY|nr:hypothetical protein DDE83_001592 [Stemphylium lycopersici]